MHIGFTGTRRGLTKAQVIRLTCELHDFYQKARGAVFHHGDCVGADEEAAMIARNMGYLIHSHPPNSNTWRAYAEFDYEEEAKSYLERNHEIVNISDRVIACPKQELEVVRSGTWATIRYATKRRVPLLVISPGGDTRET